MVSSVDEIANFHPHPPASVSQFVLVLPHPSRSFPVHIPASLPGQSNADVFFFKYSTVFYSQTTDVRSDDEDDGEDDDDTKDD